MKTKPPPKLGLLGGTFDPIHRGHVEIARCALDKLDLQQVLLIPAACPPHKTELPITPARHRLAMAELAVTDQAGLAVSRIELDRPGPSYTIDTVRAMGRQYPDTDFFWLIGADTISELPTWKDLPGLTRLCRLVPIGRPGWSLEDMNALRGVLPADAIEPMKSLALPGPLLDISASDIRRRIASGTPISSLVPTSIAEYISHHGLYQT